MEVGKPGADIEAELSVVLVVEMGRPSPLLVAQVLETLGPVMEEECHENSGQCATDMSQVGNASGLALLAERACSQIDL